MGLGGLCTGLRRCHRRRACVCPHLKVLLRVIISVHSVAVVGSDKILVGAVKEGTGSATAGALLAPLGTENGGFGSSVGVDKDRVFVGTPSARWSALAWWNAWAADSLDTQKTERYDRRLDALGPLEEKHANLAAAELAGIHSCGVAGRHRDYRHPGRHAAAGRPVGREAAQRSSVKVGSAIWPWRSTTTSRLTNSFPPVSCSSPDGTNLGRGPATYCRFSKSSLIRRARCAGTATDGPVHRGRRQPLSPEIAKVQTRLKSFAAPATTHPTCCQARPAPATATSGEITRPKVSNHRSPTMSARKDISTFAAKSKIRSSIALPAVSSMPKARPRSNTSPMAHHTRF